MIFAIRITENLSIVNKKISKNDKNLLKIGKNNVRGGHSIKMAFSIPSFFFSLIYAIMEGNIMRGEAHGH